ncbi:single-stranded-DNA-specific exonuclease RecJ [Leptolyngbya sp. AN03gr2]|uniref:single-stranded-DNA-specific exonuclease RecJ n=1 Tax=unclassified Leptolyngbya TaxID=2650499 RepID=UPI003D3177E0
MRLATPIENGARSQLTLIPGLNPVLTQILLRRGLTAAAAELFLNPERVHLPPPLQEFKGLALAVRILVESIKSKQPIAICGDYDADGMTSTALLLRVLRSLGGQADYAIPSRMKEGYGINKRMVEEAVKEGFKVILTVDNGIAAHDAIRLAQELGLVVIVTDHHDLPPVLPTADVILNPKLLPESSPYRGLAGVGVAYILAVSLVQAFQRKGMIAPLLEFYTLGTIADLAPLTGVNRRWVKRGLKILPQSKNPGIQALVRVVGLACHSRLKPDVVAFSLAPIINACGRISDPGIVIELLTTDDSERAMELAIECERVNRLRQTLCEQIEHEAVALCEQGLRAMYRNRVLVLVQEGWHQGVIGIVASRLVERYGVPVFIGTYEEDGQIIRGSARGIPEFDVFAALESAQDSLLKYGGHRSAGGFSLMASQLPQFQVHLGCFAQRWLQPHHLKPMIEIDAQVDLSQMTLDFFDDLEVLQPCGMGNPDPIFCSVGLEVVEQQVTGRDHLKFTLRQASGHQITAIAWRWAMYYPLPDWVDVAYRLRLNEWNNQRSLELQVIGLRPATALLTKQLVNRAASPPYD